MIAFPKLSVPDSVARQVMAFAEIKSAPGRWRFALEATFLTAVSLTVVSLFFSPSLAIVGLTGAFLAVTARTRPLRARATILAIMYSGYLISVAAGALTGSRPWLLTISLTVISVVAVLGYNALVGDQPGPMFLVLGAAIASYLPTIGVSVGDVVLINALAAGSACLTALLMQAIRHDTTVRDVVDSAEKAITAYTQTVPGEGDPGERGKLRDAAYASVFRASSVLESAVGSNPHGRRWTSANAKLRHLHVELVQRISLARLDGAPVAVDDMEQSRYLGLPSAGYLLRWGLSKRSLPWLAARRLAAAVLLTCAFSYGFGVGQPYWAVMTTALIITIGADRLSLTHRALHRLAGTLVGVLLFFLLHLLDLGGVLLLVVALLLVFTMQMVVVRNYALGAVFITPMALLISSAGTPYRPVLEIAGLRILDTAIGAVCSLLVIWVSSRGTPILLVRRQYRRALRALEHLLVLLAEGEHATDRGFSARRDLAFEQLQCAQILRIAQVDLPLTLGSWDEMEGALNEVSYTVLAACWTTDPPSVLDAEAMASRMQRMLAKLPPVSRGQVDAEELARELHAVMAAGINPPTEPETRTVLA